jgi:hypothetical protein
VKGREHARELGILEKAPEPSKVAPKKGWSPEKTEAYTAAKAKKHAKEMERWKEKERAFGEDYLSIPGLAHALMSGKGKDLIRSGWRRQGPLDKAFLGLGGLEMGRAALTPTEEGGPGRGERFLRAAGSTAGWLMAPHAMLPGTLAAAAAGKAGGTAGKVLDYGAGRLTPRTATQPSPLVDY